MTLVKSDIPELLTAGLKTAFFQTFGESPAQWDRVATTIPSERDTEQYAWLGALPGMREFRDERQPGDPKPYAYAIRNKTWESTLSVDRAALEDDQYGQIALRIRQMARVAKSHLDEIVFGLLGTGFEAPGYDGVPFFGTHTQGATLSNKGTDALSAASLQGAITAMMRFTDDQGRPAGTRPNVLVVPPELYWGATVLLTSALDPDPVTTASQDLAANPLRGMLTLLATPYLSSPTDWFLLDTSRVVRAVVLQMRKEFEFGSLEGSSENGFLRDQFLYGVRARYNAGFGDWRAAYGAQV